MKNIIIQAREADSNSNRNGDYTSILKTPITINAGDEVVVNNTFIDTRNITTDRIVIEEDLPVSMTANIYLHDNELFNRRRYTDTLTSIDPILSAEKRWCGGWTTFNEAGTEPPPAPLERFQFITGLELPILPGFSQIKEMNIQLRYFSFEDKIPLITPDPRGPRRYEYVPHYLVLKVPAINLGENVSPEDRSIFLRLDDKISGNVNWRDKIDPIVSANVGCMVRVKGEDDVLFKRPFVGIESERERYMKNGLDIDNILPLNNVAWNVGAKPSGGDYSQTLIAGFSLLEPNFEFIIPKKSYSPTELADFISLQINAVRTGEFASTGQIKNNEDGFGGIAPAIDTFVSSGGEVLRYDDPRWSGGPFFTNENLLEQNKKNHNLPATDYGTLPEGPLNGEVGFAGDGQGFKFSRPQVPTNYANHSLLFPIPQGGGSDGIPNMEDFTSSRMIGASQIALEYRDTFKWSYLHTPIYDAGDIVVSYNNSMSWYVDNVGAVPATPPANVVVSPAPIQPYQDRVAGTDQGYWLGAYSGISWTSLTPASLWEDTLGFDLQSLCFSPRYENTDASREVERTPPASGVPPGTEAFSKFYVNYLAFKDIPLTQKHLWTIPISSRQLVPIDRGYMKNGTNATSGEISNSALLNKYNPSALTGSDPVINFSYPGPGGTPNPAKRTSLAPVPNVVVGISDQTIPCLADVSVLDGSLNSGYFLLEINGKMINEFTGNSFNSNLIMGVLSRYYSLGNYTSGDTAGLSYIHKGEPILITELGVRILQPNGELAQVGNDNAIFVKVIKPPPPPPVIVPPKNEKKKAK